MLKDPATSPLVDYRSIFQVYGLSQTVIDKVLVELENLVKEAVTDKVLDTPDQQEAIAKLTPEQVTKWTPASNFYVHLWVLFTLPHLMYGMIHEVIFRYLTNWLIF